MWLGQKEQVARFQRVGMAELQIGDAAQVRVDAVSEFARLAGAGNLFEVDIGMKQQQPQQFAAYVAAAAHN